MTSKSEDVQEKCLSASVQDSRVSVQGLEFKSSKGKWNLCNLNLGGGGVYDGQSLFKSDGLMCNLLSKVLYKMMV